MSSMPRFICQALFCGSGARLSPSPPSTQHQDSIGFTDFGLEVLGLPHAIIYHLQTEMQLHTAEQKHVRHQASWQIS